MRHDRFESLAGAIALGEATALERAEYAAHASACSVCAADAVGDGAAPLALVAQARDAEVWRPTLDRAILARIRERQAQRARMTVGAIGWAAGLSIAANVVFATGFAGSFERTFGPAAAPPPAIIDAGIRLPAQTFAFRGAPHVRRAAHHAPRVAFERAFERAGIERARGVPPVPAAALAPVDPSGEDAVADLLQAGGTRSARTVALEAALRRPAQP